MAGIHCIFRSDINHNYQRLVNSKSFVQRIQSLPQFQTLLINPLRMLTGGFINMSKARRKSSSTLSIETKQTEEQTATVTPCRASENEGPK